MMIFQLLLRSPVILLFFRHLLFQKPLFPRLFRFGPPWGPNKKAIDPFLTPLGSTLPLPTLSGPSQDLPKNVQSEKWNHENHSRTYLKSQALTTFCKSRTSQKGPQWTWWTFPRAPWDPAGAPPPLFGALPGPSWNPNGAIQQKKHVFLDNQ